MIYAVAIPKGGVGKSTTAVHLAAKLATLSPCLLIDADSQPSAASWAAWRQDLEKRGPDPVVHHLSGIEVMTTGLDLSLQFENTVIDVGGTDAAAMRGAVLLADLVIVPLSASSFDTAALSDLQEIIKKSQAYREPVAVRVLLSRLNSSAKDTEKMRAYLKEQGLQVFNSQVMERVAFRRAIEAGATVEEQGKDKKAIEEINQFFKEVIA